MLREMFNGLITLLIHSNQSFCNKHIPHHSTNHVIFNITLNA